MDLGMQLFRQHRGVFGFPFHFNREEIGNIFFYSPLAPLERLLSFGLFMKNYFMLTYICCLFSPSVTCSRFGFIWKALKPILYVRGSARAIESRLKQQRAAGKVRREETDGLIPRWEGRKGDPGRWLKAGGRTGPGNLPMQWRVMGGMNIQ